MTAQPDFWQRRSARRLAPAPERATHIAIADRLRLHCRPGWFWSHIPSGEYRTAETGALLKRLGLQRGMLDLLLISPAGVHHWLELKRGRQPLTPEQERFIAMLRQCSMPCAVARSYDAAITQLKTWGAL